MENISLNDRCLFRAKTIWWSVSSCLMPSEDMSVLSQDDDQLYIKLMNDREEVHNAAYYAVQHLYRIAVGKMNNDIEDIETYGKQIIENAHAFGDKLAIMRDKVVKDNKENKHSNE